MDYVELEAFERVMKCAETAITFDISDDMRGCMEIDMQGSIGYWARWDSEDERRITVLDEFDEATKYETLPTDWIDQGLARMPDQRRVACLAEIISENYDSDTLDARAVRGVRRDGVRMNKPQSIYVAVHEQRNGYANMLRMRMTADIECDDGSCRVSTPGVTSVRWRGERS
jgi:hypothetical protein